MIYWTHKRTYECVPRCGALRRYASRGSTLQIGAKLSLFWGKIITFWGKVSLGVIINIWGHDYLQHIMRVAVVVMVMAVLVVLVVVVVVVVVVIITMVKAPTSPAPRGSPGTSSGTSHQPCLTSERQGSAAKIDLLNFHISLNSYHMKKL